MLFRHPRRDFGRFAERAKHPLERERGCQPADS